MTIYCINSKNYLVSWRFLKGMLTTQLNLFFHLRETDSLQMWRFKKTVRNSSNLCLTEQRQNWHRQAKSSLFKTHLEETM